MRVLWFNAVLQLLHTPQPLPLPSLPAHHAPIRVRRSALPRRRPTGGRTTTHRPSLTQPSSHADPPSHLVYMMQQTSSGLGGTGVTASPCPDASSSSNDWASMPAPWMASSAAESPLPM